MEKPLIVQPLLSYAPIIVAALLALAGGGATAQENALGPPPALEFPNEASDSAQLGVAGSLLRFALEQAADAALCNGLMDERYQDDPDELERLRAQNGANYCEDDLREKVENNEGIVHWADGARPLECGRSCLGRPFMAQTSYADRPNLRQAKMFGRLELVVDSVVDRELTLGFEALFTCKAEGGARTGAFTTDVVFGQPVIGDPGALESVIDFLLLPANISRYVESLIEEQLSTPPSTTSVRQEICTSVGAFPDDANPLFDSVLFDEAESQPLAARAVTSTALPGDRATIELLRIARAPAPPFLAEATRDHPGLDEFLIYVNGDGANIPTPLDISADALSLPPEGGSVPLNLCKTVGLAGADALQVLFVSGMGGAVWSQFSRAEQFGEDEVRTMTTGRSIVRPAMDGPPDPITGRPTRTKPTTQTVREFELTYRISFSPQPGLVATDRTSTGGRGGAVVGGVLTDRAVSDRVVAVDPDRPPPEPCRPI